MKDGQRPRVVVIGAGVGGVSFAIALKRQIDIKNVDLVIFDKGSDIGGTWRENTYPGCSSDIPIHFYSLSTDLKADWPRSHGYQPDILEYWQLLTAKHGIYQYITFNTQVVSVVWDVNEQLYHIEAVDTISGTKTRTTAQIVISAIGILAVAKFPQIPGISTFKGESFHSAHWDYGIALRDKRVAIIGNGSSASQFIPHILNEPTTKVTNFCRTPSWILPEPPFSYSSLYKWSFSYVPFSTRIYRIFTYFRCEFNYIFFRSPVLRHSFMKKVKQAMLDIAPPEYHDKLIPNFPLGCKRIVFGPQYLEALKKPNMTVNWDGVSEIVEDGVVTKKGDKLAFDVLIYATGYITDQYLMDVRGVGGKSIQDYYRSHDGPQAYFGTTVPGFPNFFMLSGPNTATGFTSVIFIEEIQINYALQLIKPVLQGLAKSFEVKDSPTEDYNKQLRARFSRPNLVFMYCSSWYRVGGNGKVASIYPNSSISFWWSLRSPNWNHYKAVGAERWRRQRISARIRRLVGLSLVGALLVWGCMHPEDLMQFWDAQSQMVWDRSLSAFSRITAHIGH